MKLRKNDTCQVQMYLKEFKKEKLNSINNKQMFELSLSLEQLSFV